ncbi:PLC-like phosphodiesterase [Paraphaeosphaeria sporulosa]|uniref:PLC-like phosphodiesterase n=1 Tax=Paraphaeosphaeria sporulosa TaxID=1460663 RepID=A0A177CY95_9PLEO|nr:PLC-like phosphodiesterase [Paraphaeosphaeria sporulosa]OAG12171.1 PLC-like phosphodiesterase [Paraphaeosphaeria sporulosa]
MPSKGVLCFSYLTVPGTSIEFTVPGKAVTKSDLQQYQTTHLEVESSALPHFKFTGRFQFVVRRDGRDLTTQWVDVNSATGKLGDGTLKTMDQTPAVFVEDLVVCYGFYDAGPGVAGLPKQHLCYVTVTRNLENWMGDAIAQDQDMSSKKFSKMVLPAAHDIGMNSMAIPLSLLSRAGTGAIKEVLGRELPHVLSIFNKAGDAAVNRIAPDIIRALAITQKDSLESILKIGARYFEFRPAQCHRQLQSIGGLEDTWYFQHGVIPGMKYVDFLSTLVKFLDEHKDEVVVVQNRWDGVPGECPRPSNDDLGNMLQDVLRGKELQAGNLDDMLGKSIRDLRNEKKRLIVLQNARQVSNYDDDANATLDGDSMVSKLNDMARDLPKGQQITLLQCQATATNIRDVIIASVLDADVSTSPILATKPVCDAKILPLLRGECGKCLTREESVVVLLNDFFDGATADVAIELCKERMR